MSRRASGSKARFTRANVPMVVGWCGWRGNAISSYSPCDDTVNILSECFPLLRLGRTRVLNAKGTDHVRCHVVRGRQGRVRQRETAIIDGRGRRSAYIR